MRVMAIDYGDARTGVSISDADGKIAGEALVIHQWDSEKLIDTLCELVASRGVGVIVLGHPLNMDGSRGPRAEKSEALSELLSEKTGYQVVLVDERRTTIDAHRILSEAGRRGKKRKATVDAVAAALILETYLNKINMKHK